MSLRAVNFLLVNPGKKVRPWTSTTIDQLVLHEEFMLMTSTKFRCDALLQVNYLNFLAESNFKEDIISRNMRPTMPQLLELNR